MIVIFITAPNLYPESFKEEIKDRIDKLRYNAVPTVQNGSPGE